MTKYIGPWEIATEEQISDNAVRVTFQPYTSGAQTFQPPERDYTMKTYVNIVTEKAQDFTELRKAQYDPLIEDIISLLGSYDVNISLKSGANDLEYVFRAVMQRIDEIRRDLEDKYWGAEEDEKTLRQLFQRWADHKDTDIRKLKIIPSKKSKKKK